MSTYNGERFIHEQIESILSQQGVDVSLLVRDDGSSDATLNILQEYQSKGKLTFYTGQNLGPALSFMHLLQHAPSSSYYAFADQDDVWLPEKLAVAISQLEDKTNPMLYFCQTQLTDAELHPIKSVIIHPYMTFGESLIYKFIGGCTMVMNHPLRHALGLKLPKIMPMHDIWIYSFALSIGAKVVFDSQPHIKYRQHSNNTVGQGQGALYEWTLRFHRLLGHDAKRYAQAVDLRDCYMPLITQENQKILNLFIKGKESLSARVKMLLSKELRCSDKTTQRLFWINLLLNKY